MRSICRVRTSPSLSRSLADWIHRKRTQVKATGNGRRQHGMSTTDRQERRERLDHVDSCSSAVVSCALWVPTVRNDNAMTPARTMKPVTAHRPARKLPVRSCSQPVR
jgi:hypothetical protein